MKYNSKILEKIDVINAVLYSLNQQNIFKNPDFLIDEMSSEFYLMFHHTKKVNSPRLSIICSNFDLQIDLDRIDEAFVWSNEQLEKDKDDIKKLLVILFTSIIKARYCG
jgi:hypothetical protein